MIFEIIFVIVVMTALITFIVIRMRNYKKEEKLRKQRQRDRRGRDPTRMMEEDLAAAEGLTVHDYRKKLKKEQQQERYRQQMKEIEDAKKKFQKESEKRQQEREEQKKNNELAELKAKELAKQQEEQAEDELNQWKDLFEMEAEGDLMFDVALEDQDLLAQFINEIKEKKLCNLQELSSNFKISVEDCVRRIKHLIEDKNCDLNGVFDGRGSFLHVTNEEFEKISVAISQRGRVGVNEISQIINKEIIIPDSQKKKNVQETEYLSDEDQRIHDLSIDEITDTDE
eukprot:TRINITY_DN1752_c0_g1_i1.p2 TRINITY_DN1752_c0_g1~~TRINITY_DN1752_c0_g1_i1.p2  ORF type:complete len:284 (-),score=107.70 TRINITY_DN1752_c0_g1_i1:1202-2053(-)